MKAGLNLLASGFVEALFSHLVQWLTNGYQKSEPTVQTLVLNWLLLFSCLGLKSDLK